MRPGVSSVVRREGVLHPLPQQWHVSADVLRWRRAGSTQEEMSLLVQEEMRKADITGVNRPISWDGATKVRLPACSPGAHALHHFVSSAPAY